MGRTQHKGRSRVAVEEREDRKSRSTQRESKARALDEERASVDPLSAPLERKASGPILDDLLMLELELHRRYRAHLANQARRPQPSEAKSAIISALRSKH